MVVPLAVPPWPFTGFWDLFCFESNAGGANASHIISVSGSVNEFLSNLVKRGVAYVAPFDQIHHVFANIHRVITNTFERSGTPGDLEQLRDLSRVFDKMGGQ